MGSVGIVSVAVQQYKRICEWHQFFGSYGYGVTGNRRGAEQQNDEYQRFGGRKCGACAHFAEIIGYCIANVRKICKVEYVLSDISQIAKSFCENGWLFSMKIVTLSGLYGELPDRHLKNNNISLLTNKNFLL